MKTTLDLPDDLMRSVKIHAAKSDMKLKDLVAQLLRRGLDTPGATATAKPRLHRVKRPVIECRHAAKGGDATPEQLAQLLIDQETEWHR